MHASAGVGSPSPVVSAVKPDSTFWSLYLHHTVAANHISWHSDTNAAQQTTQL